MRSLKFQTENDLELIMLLPGLISMCARMVFWRLLLLGFIDVVYRKTDLVCRCQIIILRLKSVADSAVTLSSGER